jgi:MFS family permease
MNAAGTSTTGWRVFPPLVWTILVGTLLMRTAFFMVWPFLAIILEREFHLSPSQIGAILSTAFLSSAFVGFYAGAISDRYGRRPVILAGCVGAIGAYALLAVASNVLAYTIGAFMVGFTRSMLEPPSKALIADHIADQRRRDLAFHARYFLINVGGAVGPLVGLAFGLSAQQETFWLTAVAYVAFAVAFRVTLRRTREPTQRRGEPTTSMADAVRVLRADRQFLLLLLAMTLTMSAYAQQESTLIQYVALEGGGRAVRLVTALIVTNALTVVVFQFPLLRALAGVDPYVRTYIGLALYAVSFATYPFLPPASIVAWVVVTVVFSVGEAILFPTLQLQVDRMAPAHMKGSYFGAAGLSAIGFGLGPMAGGFLLQHTGGGVTFFITALGVVAAGWCCRAASRRRAPVPVRETAVG